MNTRNLQVLTVGALLWGVLRVILVWDELPQTLASHFDAQGKPNGFSTKEQFFIVYGLMTGFVLSTLLVGIPLMKVIPPKYLNIPHRAYWLTGGRLNEAQAKISKAMWWMCVGTATLLTVVLELVIQSNLKGSTFSSSSMLFVMGAYFLFIVIWLIKMMTSFTPPK